MKIKYFLPVLFLLMGGFHAFTQNPADMLMRSDMDPVYAPFYHGVASGDPLTDRVMLWTRISPDSPGSKLVNWTIALDTGLTQVVNSGVAETHDSIDFTVKVDADGLSADTWYYYRFEFQGRKSLTGRTKTVPDGDKDQLRFAVVSCSNYPVGYFNAYEKISERNDIDAVIHLGDYIYEYENAGSLDRPHDPVKEIITIDDYRLRHSQYKLDHDLRRLHQMYPWLVIWDDHEGANDSWSGGAENHDPTTEGSWSDRKKAFIKTYFEWMPIRRPNEAQFERIYRTIHYGDLLDIFMLDTRIYDRDEQLSGVFVDPNDPSRNLLGPEQLGWLSEGMKNSSAQWKVLAQQVMVAPLEVPLVGPVNLDQWDGYAAERQRLYDTLTTHEIDDVVVITGDIHSAWASDLPSDTYNPQTGSGSVAVEFVTTSVTSSNLGVNFAESIVLSANPHIKFTDLANHGYFILDVDKQRTQADFYYVSSIETPDNYTETYQTSWYCEDQETNLQNAGAAASFPGPYILPPPATPANLVGISQNKVREISVLGTFPNPFQESFLVKHFLSENVAISIEILDLQGRRMMIEELGEMRAGLHINKISPRNLTQGTYLLKIQAGDQVVTTKIVRN